MTNYEKAKEEGIISYKEKFCYENIEICADCFHAKESHYWNGGGRIESAGYDTCRVRGCKCASDKWMLKRVITESDIYVSFLSSFAEKIKEGVEKDRKYGTNGILKFKEDSPYYQSGEKERELKNITEIHYCYPSLVVGDSTAFESDTEGTGFTIQNKYIKEFEIKSPPSVSQTKAVEEDEIH